MQVLKIKKLNDSATIPTKGSEESAGWDLYADITNSLVIEPSQTMLISTGLSMEIPKGCFVAIYPRSGLASKRGLILANTVGIIDSDYRGEVMIALKNTSNEDQVINHNDRIAQMIIQQYYTTDIVEVQELSDTNRGTGGFGSTGTNKEDK